MKMRRLTVNRMRSHVPEYPHREAYSVKRDTTSSFPVWQQRGRSGYGNLGWNSFMYFTNYFDMKMYLWVDSEMQEYFDDFFLFEQIWLGGSGGKLFNGHQRISNQPESILEHFAFVFWVDRLFLSRAFRFRPTDDGVEYTMLPNTQRVTVKNCHQGFVVDIREA